MKAWFSSTLYRFYIAVFWTFVCIWLSVWISFSFYCKRRQTVSQYPCLFSLASLSDTSLRYNQRKCQCREEKRRKIFRAFFRSFLRVSWYQIYKAIISGALGKPYEPIVHICKAIDLKNNT